MPLSTLSPLLAFLIAAPARPTTAHAAAASSQPVRAQSRFSTSERAAMARITPASLSGPLRFLSDDLLEGRKPGQPGDELAVKYLASQLEAFGMKPAGDNGSFLQAVPLIELRAEVPKDVHFTAGGRDLLLWTIVSGETNLEMSSTWP